MTWDPRVHVGTAALVIGQGRLLMLRRGPACSHGASQWSVPGGWVDRGERAEEAAARELREEVGLHADARRMTLVGAVTNEHPPPVDTVVCLFYFPALVTGKAEILEPDKADDLRWLTWDEASWLDLFPPFRSLVDGGYRW